MFSTSSKFLLRALTLVVFLGIVSCGKNDPTVNQVPYAPSPYGNSPYYQYPGGGGGYAGYPYNGYPYPGYSPSYNGSNGYYPSGPYNGPQSSPYGYNYPGTYYPYYYYPQMPQGYPSAYTPFLPIDNYYRNNPAYGPQYWQQIWSNWLVTAQYWQVSPYDFNMFWNSYCPLIFTSGNSYNIYVTLGQQFYSWATPGVTINVGSSSPSQFWINYIGIVY